MISSGPGIVHDEVSESVDWTALLSLCALSLSFAARNGGAGLAGSGSSVGVVCLTEAVDAITHDSPSTDRSGV